MQVKLISITQSQIRTKEDDRFLTPEEHIVWCARVSNPDNQLNLESSPKLIKYCIKNKHWSIFEQVTMGVSIQTSRAIAQQIIRHKSFSFQEFSQRYAEVQEFEPVELRLQAKVNRQSSTDITDDDVLNERVTSHIQESEWLYRHLIKNGIAKESARFVLPATTQTTIFMFGSARSWIHYLELRCDEHTQKEHRLIANEIKQIFNDQFPNIKQALTE